MRKSAASFDSLPDLGQGHRSRVFGRLLAEAVTLVRRGRIPSVAEVAMAARVLDLGVWLLAPVVIPTIYAAYKDIFDIDAVASGTPPVESGGV